MLLQLPVLPGDLATLPVDPGVRAREDARVALAKNRKGLAQCRGQYDDLKGFYNRLKAGLKHG